MTMDNIIQLEAGETLVEITCKCGNIYGHGSHTGFAQCPRCNHRWTWYALSYKKVGVVVKDWQNNCGDDLEMEIFANA